MKIFPFSIVRLQRVCVRVHILSFLYLPIHVLRLFWTHFTSSCPVVESDELPRYLNSSNCLKYHIISGWFVHFYLINSSSTYDLIWIYKVFHRSRRRNNPAQCHQDQIQFEFQQITTSDTFTIVTCFPILFAQITFSSGILCNCANFSFFSFILYCKTKSSKIQFFVYLSPSISVFIVCSFDSAKIFQLQQRNVHTNTCRSVEIH